ncbi:MAG: hypothetical protein HY242_03080 [Afipia sp.]|nr:hypothetical protein [Afipia sp.]
MSRSTHILLGLGLLGLVAETVISHPALTVDKVKLFKVTTPNSEIVIGLTKDEVDRLPGKDATGVAKVLINRGSMPVWEYGERRGVSGQQEEAPVRHFVLTSTAAVRIETYKTALRVVPITEERMAEAEPENPPARPFSDTVQIR